MEMIFEELHNVAPGQKLTRENIKSLFAKAYQERLEKWLASRILAPWGISVKQFVAAGVKQFGESEFARLSQSLESERHSFNEELLVIGWGKSPYATMIYSIDKYGDHDHKYAGVAAIGSGAEVAWSTLLMLGQSRQSSLEETLYSVAAAKFAAEKSHGEAVGERTGMFVTWKRTEKDRVDKPVGVHVQEDEIAALRELWEDYGRPRIPDQGWSVIDKVSRKLGFEPRLSRGWIEMGNRITARMKKEAERAEREANSPSQSQPSNPQTSSGQQ
ncbi:MAG TPA: hypothetical protein VFW31_04500 [Candidatus Angelobacter sp.]|nr:hypothetical protein [Candidatus Angelobacter sp.]